MEYNEVIPTPEQISKYETDNQDNEVIPTPEQIAAHESDTWGNVLIKSAKSIVPATEKQLAGLFRATGETPLLNPAIYVAGKATEALTGTNILQSGAQKAADYLAAKAKAAEPSTTINAPAWSLKGVVGGALSGMAQMAPAFAAGAITKNPLVALGGFGAGGFGTGYETAKEQGAGTGIATLAGTGYGLVDSVIGAIPVLGALKAGSPFIKTVAHSAGAGAIGGEIQQAMKLGIDKGTISPDMTIGDAWETIKRTAPETLATGALMGGIMGGGAHLLKPKVKTETTTKPVEDAATLSPDETAINPAIAMREALIKEHNYPEDSIYDKSDEEIIDLHKRETLTPQDYAKEKIKAIDPVDVYKQAETEFNRQYDKLSNLYETGKTPTDKQKVAYDLAQKNFTQARIDLKATKETHPVEQPTETDITKESQPTQEQPIDFTTPKGLAKIKELNGLLAQKMRDAGYSDEIINNASMVEKHQILQGYRKTQEQPVGTETATTTKEPIITTEAVQEAPQQPIEVKPIETTVPETKAQQPLPQIETNPNLSAVSKAVVTKVKKQQSQMPLTKQQNNEYNNLKSEIKKIDSDKKLSKTDAVSKLREIQQQIENNPSENLNHDARMNMAIRSEIDRYKMPETPLKSTMIVGNKEIKMPTMYKGEETTPTIKKIQARKPIDLKEVSKQVIKNAAVRNEKGEDISIIKKESDRHLLEGMKNDIGISEAGKRSVNPETGENMSTQSTFPDWAKNSGIKKKNFEDWYNRATGQHPKGLPLAPLQRKDLIAYMKAAKAEAKSNRGSGRIEYFIDEQRGITKAQKDAIKKGFTPQTAEQVMESRQLTEGDSINAIIKDQHGESKDVTLTVEVDEKGNRKLTGSGFTLSEGDKTKVIFTKVTRAPEEHFKVEKVNTAQKKAKEIDKESGIQFKVDYQKLTDEVPKGVGEKTQPARDTAGTMLTLKLMDGQVFYSGKGNHYDAIKEYVKGYGGKAEQIVDGGYWSKTKGIEWDSPTASELGQKARAGDIQFKIDKNIKAKLPEDEFKTIEKNAPDNKYINWMMIQYLKNKSNPDIHEQLREYTSSFDQYVNQNKIENRDINQYKTLDEVRDVVHLARDKVSKSEQKKIWDAGEGLQEGYDFTTMRDDDNVSIVTPHTRDASVYYGKDSKWCISMKNESSHWESYTKLGIEFNIIKDKQSGEMYAIAVYPHTKEKPAKKGVYDKQDELMFATGRAIHSPKFEAFMDKHNIDFDEFDKSNIVNDWKPSKTLSNNADFSDVHGSKIDKATGKEKVFANIHINSDVESLKDIDLPHDFNEFIIGNNKKLRSLEGLSPDFTGKIKIYSSPKDSENIASLSLKGLPKNTKMIEIRYTNILSFEGASPEFKGQIYIINSHWHDKTTIDSFKGIPKKTASLILIDARIGSKSLEGLSPDFTGEIVIEGSNIESFEGLPENYNGTLEMSNNKDLKSFKGLPVNVRFVGVKGSGIKSFDGLPKGFSGTIRGMPKPVEYLTIPNGFTAEQFDVNSIQITPIKSEFKVNTEPEPIHVADIILDHDLGPTDKITTIDKDGKKEVFTIKSQDDNNNVILMDGKKLEVNLETIENGREIQIAETGTPPAEKINFVEGAESKVMNTMNEAFQEVFKGRKDVKSEFSFVQATDLKDLPAASKAELKKSYGIDVDNLTPEEAKDYVIKGSAEVIPVGGKEVKAIIKLGFDATNKDALHEVWHIVDKTLLTDAERKVLTLKFGDKDGIISSERIADGFAEFASKDMTKVEKGVTFLDPIKKIFNKIKLFFDSIGNALRGHGFTNYEKIFTEAVTGKMAGRELKSLADKGLEFAVRKEPKDEDPVQERFSKNISTGEKKTTGTWKERMTEAAHRAYEMFVAKEYPFKRATDDMINALPGGEKLLNKDNPYMRLRLLSGVAGKAMHWLQHGSFDFSGEGGTYKKTGAGLKEILDPIYKAGNEKYFINYLVAKRAIELSGRGIKSPFDLTDAKDIVNRYAGEFESVAKGLYDFKTKLLEQYRDAGLLSKEQFDKIIELNKFHVPFYRVTEEIQSGTGKGIEGFNVLKAIKGNAELHIIDPVESIIKDTFRLLELAEKNKTMQNLEQLSKRSGDVGAGFLKEIKVHGLAKFKLSDDIITVYNNGKPTYYQVPKGLGRAIKNLDSKDTPLLIKILSIPANTLRAGATLITEFMGRNVIRDVITAYVTSKYGFNIKDIGRGLLDSAKESDSFWLWNAVGGSQSLSTAIDREGTQKGKYDTMAGVPFKGAFRAIGGILIKQHQTGELNKWEAANAVIKSPIDALRALTEMSEEGTRLATFEAGLKKEGMTESGMMAAAFESKDLMDFSRYGSVVRAANQIIPFMNASIQGSDKVIRTLLKVTSDDPIIKAEGQKAWYKAAGIMAASVALYVATADDEKIKAIPRWQKDIYWLFPVGDKVFRIPKPFELGMIFGTIPQRMAEYLKTNDTEAFKDLEKTAIGTFIPNFTPAVLTPLMENWANKSSFTNRPIVPQGKENLLPRYQTRPTTTATATGIARVFEKIPIIGDTWAASPAKVENLIRGWSGGLGIEGLHIADKVAGVLGITDNKVSKPEETLADMPLIKAFVSRYPSSGGESVNTFYEQFKQIDSARATYKKLLQQGEKEKAAEIRDNYPIGLNLHHISTAMGNINKVIERIYSHPTMSSSEKRLMIDNLYKQQDVIAQRANVAIKRQKAMTDALKKQRRQ